MAMTGAERTAKWARLHPEQEARRKTLWRRTRAVLRDRHYDEYLSLIDRSLPVPHCYHHALTALTANHPDEYATIRSGLDREMP